MKNFRKIMLIFAGTVACLGAICMVIAFAMGLTTEGLKQMARDGKFVFDMKEMKILEFEDDSSDVDVDTDAKGDIGVVLDASVKVKINEDERIYTTSESFNNMEIEFGAGVLDIYYDDVEEIEIHEKNNDGFKMGVKNNTLKIENDLEVTFGDVDDMNNRSLVIVIPTGMTFDDIDLKIGAAQADIKDLSAKDISITIGAGQANISNITTDNMEMEVGAGEATVSNLAVTNLDVEAGMGQVSVEVSGTEADYNYNVECGMGNVVVGNHSYGGLGAEHHGKNHNATKTINVECGMGEVVVKFIQ